MMAKQPSERYDSYAELLQDLERVLDVIEVNGPNPGSSGDDMLTGNLPSQAGTGRSLWKLLLSSFGRKKAP